MLVERDAEQREIQGVVDRGAHVRVAREDLLVVAQPDPAADRQAVVVGEAVVQRRGQRDQREHEEPEDPRGDEGEPGPRIRRSASSLPARPARRRRGSGRSAGLATPPCRVLPSRGRCVSSGAHRRRPRSATAFRARRICVCASGTADRRGLQRREFDGPRPGTGSTGRAAGSAAATSPARCLASIARIARQVGSEVRYSCDRVSCLAGSQPLAGPMYLPKLSLSSIHST